MHKAAREAQQRKATAQTGEKTRQTAETDFRGRISTPDAAAELADLCTTAQARRLPSLETSDNPITVAGLTTTRISKSRGRTWSVDKSRGARTCSFRTIGSCFFAGVFTALLVRHLPMLTRCFGMFLCPCGIFMPFGMVAVAEMLGGQRCSLAACS
jgi:hypothetical protein